MSFTLTTFTHKDKTDNHDEVILTRLQKPFSQFNPKCDS